MSEQVPNKKSDRRVLTKAERKIKRREEKMEIRRKEESRKKRKKILVGVVIFATLAIVAGSILTKFRDGGEATLVAGVEVTENDWVKGNRDAQVVLVEYADFQCPACVSYASVVKELSEEYEDKLGVVFRHFPLKQLHSNAETTAWAAEAAGMQGKFWEMHDLLYERQDNWSDSSDIRSVVEGYAQELDLDIGKFKSDLESDFVSDKVDSSYRSAMGLGLNSTPTFFLNGQRLKSIRSYDQFREIIGKAIAEGV